MQIQKREPGFFPSAVLQCDMCECWHHKKWRGLERDYNKEETRLLWNYSKNNPGSLPQNGQGRSILVVSLEIDRYFIANNEPHATD